MYGGLKILQVHFISETNHVEVKEKKILYINVVFLSPVPVSTVSLQFLLMYSLIQA